jgi:NADH-quinone oxidoreductase subunit G
MFSVPARLNIRTWASMSVRMWFPQRQFYTQRIPQYDPPPDAPTVNLKINNRNVSVPAGTTILKACKKSHIFIPTLCYHPMLSIVGQCRVCLVELGNGKLVPSCATEVSEGMVVKTNSPEVVDSIKHNLQFLRCRHPNACMTCEANGQ